MKEFLTVVLAFLGVVVGLGVIYGAVMFQAYLSPIYTRWQQRNIDPPEPRQFKPDYRACCPPGLGCNDPSVHGECRRQLAYKLASADEVGALDQHWSEYCREPSAMGLDVWETYRDTLVGNHLKEIDEPKRKELLGVTETIEHLTGELVVADKKARFDPYGDHYRRSE